MVDLKRLIKLSDDFEHAFPNLGFRNRDSFVTTGEKVLVVDPTYLADVYDSADEAADYVRDRGLFLMDFGGDTNAPVWWKPPFLVVPISMHLADLKRPAGAKTLAKAIGCDSGSFVFLPLSTNIPGSVRESIEEALEEGNAVALRLPAGQWTAYYEQFEAAQPNMISLYRNIVLKHTPIRSDGTP